MIRPVMHKGQAMRQMMLSLLTIGAICVFTPLMSFLSEEDFSPAMPLPTEQIAITGVYVEPVDDVETWNFLRFYADGTALAAGIGQGENDICTAWLNIEQWLNKDNADFPAGIGVYQLEGSTITFTVTHPQGDVDYTGDYTPEELRLDIHSHINGFQATDRYYQNLDSLCE